MSDTAMLAVILTAFVLWYHSSEAHRKIGELKRKLEALEKPKREPLTDADRESARAAMKAWEAKMAAKKLAEERTARNREVKRRAKERKSTAQKERLLQAVAESQQFEQRRRNAIARENGWDVHPNDVEPTI